jgi:hypothetical protein
MEIKAIFCCLIFLLGSLQEVVSARRRAIGPPPPTPALVQAFPPVFRNGGGSPQNFVLTSNPTAPDTIAVMIVWSNTATISSFVNASSTAYVNQAWASGAATCDFGSMFARFYYLKNLAGGVNDKTLTVTFSSAPAFVWFMAEEVSNVSTTAPIDKVDCGTQAVTTAPSSPTLTPTNNNSFLLSMVADVNANPRTYTAGTTPAYIRDGSSGTASLNEEHFVQTTAASITGNWTTSSTVNSITSLVVLH